MIAQTHWLPVLALIVTLTACPNDPPQQTNRAPTAAFNSLEMVHASTTGV
jgi:hypothetical protein